MSTAVDGGAVPGLLRGETKTRLQLTSNTWCSRARELTLSVAVAQTVVYDIVGEREESWAQVRSGVTDLADVRADVKSFAWANPAVTWHVIARTTTTTETLADHLLENPPVDLRPAPARTTPPARRVR